MSTIPFDRLFSMPAFEGLRAIKIQQVSQNDIPVSEILSIIEHIDPDYHSYDIEASTELLYIIDVSISTSNSHYYRCCIKTLILHSQPAWARMMRLGRRRFVNKLERDQQSIFREANLLMDPPDDDVIEWWDEVSGLIRLEIDKIKMEQARKAEKLTLDYEEEKLVSIGVNKKPKWVAIDDNTAGYDVLSYKKNKYGLINKLIEVKSTTASPLRFFLSRNEWKKANESGESYYFYIWDMKPSPPRLYIKTVADIIPHIPKDNLKGKWVTSEIPISI